MAPDGPAEPAQGAAGLGCDRDDLAARAEQAGADGYLAKPGDRVAFLDYVRNICAITYSPEDLP